jgi:formylmethanofuran dehydrogenase subunit E
MENRWCKDHRGREYDFRGFMEHARDFHGYPAPGLILGGVMVDLAREKLPPGCLFDAVCETRACLPDAVQLLTLCTIGNGWLKIIDSGRFALTLYDKNDGNGVRVAMDPERLKQYPEIMAWFLKLKPKSEQDGEALLAEFERAGADLLKVESVQVDLEKFKKSHLGQIGHCPECGEPYPVRDGELCRFCAGERYFK